MVPYADIVYWGRIHNVIVNRVSIINQMHHCQYERNAGNPCKLRHKGGTYEVTYCGETVAEWKLYDCDGTESALSRVDMLARALWASGSRGWAYLEPVAQESSYALGMA